MTEVQGTHKKENRDALLKVGDVFMRIYITQTLCHGFIYLYFVKVRSIEKLHLGISCKLFDVKSSYASFRRQCIVTALKGLSHEIDFKNFDKNLQNLA
jgi:hypothetical protein